MIIVIEGADGTGKTTLAEALSSKIKAIRLHVSFSDTWDIEDVHRCIIEDAMELDSKGVDVILDRWAVSEEIYASVFRGKPAYDTKALLDEYKEFITFIFCRNDKAAENHKKNKKTRHEMFDDMSDVSRLFDEYVDQSDLDWYIYDFTKDFTKEFVDTIAALK